MMGKPPKRSPMPKFAPQKFPKPTRKLTDAIDQRTIAMNHGTPSSGGAHPLPSDYCQSDQDNGNSERFYGHADNRG